MSSSVQVGTSLPDSNVIIIETFAFNPVEYNIFVDYLQMHRDFNPFLDGDEVQVCSFQSWVFVPIHTGTICMFQTCT